MLELMLYIHIFTKFVCYTCVYFEYSYTYEMDMMTY